jgi:hypothetical protein
VQTGNICSNPHAQSEHERPRSQSQWEHRTTRYLTLRGFIDGNAPSTASSQPWALTWAHSNGRTNIFTCAICFTL